MLQAPKLILIVLDEYVAVHDEKALEGLCPSNSLKPGFGAASTPLRFGAK